MLRRAFDQYPAHFPVCDPNGHAIYAYHESGDARKRRIVTVAEIRRLIRLAKTNTQGE